MNQKSSFIQILKSVQRVLTSDTTVQALIRHPADALDAYLAMVEENEIRVGLSSFERARIALKANEQGVFPLIKQPSLVSIVQHHAPNGPKSAVS